MIKSNPYGVISNRSQYTVETDMVVAGGEWELHARGIMIRRMRGTTAWIEPDPVRGEMTLKNLNTMPCTIRLMLPNGKSHRVHAGGRSTLIITPADMALD